MSENVMKGKIFTTKQKNTTVHFLDSDMKEEKENFPNIVNMKLEQTVD